jgi:hypothetical protein
MPANSLTKNAQGAALLFFRIVFRLCQAFQFVHKGQSDRQSEDKAKTHMNNQLNTGFLIRKKCLPG